MAAPPSPPHAPMGGRKRGETAPRPHSGQASDWEGGQVPTKSRDARAPPWRSPCTGSSFPGLLVGRRGLRQRGAWGVRQLTGSSSTIRLCDVAPSEEESVLLKQQGSKDTESSLMLAWLQRARQPQARQAPLSCAPLRRCRQSPLILGAISGGRPGRVLTPPHQG